MNNFDLERILNLHKLWLEGIAGGVRANLRDADLRRADLIGANLIGANLSRADLIGANLRDADLRRADLIGANLRDADLSGADLIGANLRDADLSGADLIGVKTSIDTLFFAQQCPEIGSYIAYKKARGMIVELEIPKDAKRSSATSRKCRASKAKVLSITYPDGSPGGNSVCSDRDSTFVYTVGETINIDNFEEDRWIECAAGIHHFITRGEAVVYE